MTTARIIGLSQVHTVDADPRSDASIVTAVRTVGASPTQLVEFEFDDAPAEIRTYRVCPDGMPAYIGRRGVPQYAAMRPPEHWGRRLLNFVLAVFGTIFMLAILASAAPVATILRAVRWCAAVPATKPPRTRGDLWMDRLFNIITPPAVWAILAVIFAARFWRRLRSRV